MDSQRLEMTPNDLNPEAVWREVSSVKELLLSHIERIDLAIRVAHEDAVRHPTECQKALGCSERLYDEKFNSVDKQLKERDIRIEQTAIVVKMAVDSALEAAEKAVGKAEASTVKQIDAQSIALINAVKSLDDKITDVKDRLTKIEGQGLGKQEQGKINKDVWGYVVGAIGLLVTLLTIVITIMRNYKG